MTCAEYKLTCYIVIDDLSDHRNATQSTTHQGAPDQYKAGNAVDRDVTTCMRTIPIGQNSPDKTVWWKVDLGEIYSIYNVSIRFKNYDGYGNYVSFWIDSLMFVLTFDIEVTYTPISPKSVDLSSL